MRIGELAEVTGVAPRLLRYYEMQGLLRPARAANGYRDYDQSAAMTVSQIRGLLEAGLSTQEILQLLPCTMNEVPDLEPCPEVLDLLRTRLAGLDSRIGALSGARAALRRFLSTAENAAAVR